jgi:hypothetical protein
MTARRAGGQRRLSPLLLLLLMATATTTALLAADANPTAPLDLPLPLGDGVYNPSMAVHAGYAYVVARATRLRWDTSGLKWIVNRAYLCGFPLDERAAGGGGDGGNNSSSSLPPSLSWLPDAEAEMAAAELDAASAAADGAIPPPPPLPPPRRRCVPLDPWSPSSFLSNESSYVECRASPSSGRDPWDATGVDDTKLFAWPGRGLWAVTGRRPPVQVASSSLSSSSSPQSALVAAAATESKPSSSRWPPERRCPQPVVWRQFLFRLAAEGEPVDLAAFSGGGGGGKSTSNNFLRGPPPLPDTGGYAWQPDPPKYRPFGVSEGWWWSGEKGGGGGNGGGNGDTSFWPMFEPLRPGEEGLRRQAEHVEMLRRQRRRRRRGGGKGRRRRRQHRRPPAALAAAAAALDAASDYCWELAARSPPLQLSLADAFSVYGRGYDVYEKNWMPLALPVVEGGAAGRAAPLYVVHSLHPYRVYEVAPNGTAILIVRKAAQEATERALREALVGGEGGADASTTLLPRVHGGPPVIYYAPQRGPARLLGVLHYWLPRGKTGGRSYHHRLFFAAVPATTGGGDEAAASFAIERVARRALPLRMDGVGAGGEMSRQRRRGGTYASVAFASGLHHDKKAAGGGTGGGGGGSGSAGKEEQEGAVVVTYGSGDASSRALVLKESEVEGMFS